MSSSWCRTRSRTRWTRSWLRAGELPRPTGTRRRRLVRHARRRGAQEVGQAARQAVLLRPRLGAIRNARGAPLDRAVAHDRAPRPCHQLRSAPLATIAEERTPNERVNVPDPLDLERPIASANRGVDARAPHISRPPHPAPHTPHPLPHPSCHTPLPHTPHPCGTTQLGGDSERARSHARSCRHARSSVASLATSVVRPSSLSADLRRSSRTCGRSARARCSCRCEGFAAVRAATQRQLSRCVRVTAGLLGGRRLGGPAVGRSASESGLGQPGVVRHY